MNLTVKGGRKMLHIQQLKRDACPAGEIARCDAVAPNAECFAEIRSWEKIVQIGQL